MGAGPEAALQEEVDYEGLGEGFPLHINMMAGALAGISEHAIMFPVDVIRVSSAATMLAGCIECRAACSGRASDAGGVARDAKGWKALVRRRGVI